MDTCHLFEEDEVYVHSSSKGYTFGLILQNSEFLSSSEDEEEEEEERLQKGTVRVAWHPSGKETVVAENKVHLVDRSLMPGDVVRRPIMGKGSQCGYVADMEVKAHVRVLRSNKYIYNIDSHDLTPILPFESNQEVLLDSWWGRVDHVNVDLVLTFPDGAKCRVDEADLDMFEDITDKPRHGEFSMGPHYPGQELKGPMDLLAEAKWIHSTPRYNHKIAMKIGKAQIVSTVVEKVDVKSVEVQWVFGGTSGQDSIHTPPPKIVTGENLARLKVLHWFSHCSLQIGDRMLYRVKNDDVLVSINPRQIYDPEVSIKKERGMFVPEGFQANKKTEDDTQVTSVDQATAVAAPDTQVDDDENHEEDADFVDMDDDEDSDSGDEKVGLLSGRSVGARGSKKRNKGTYKSSAARAKANKANQKSGPKRRFGRTIERLIKPDMLVEVETELTTSWATVMWQDGKLEKDIPSAELFPVHHLDEHEFFPGDFVLPNVELPQPADYGVVNKADHEGRTCTVHWFKAYDVGKETRPTMVEASCEVSVYDIDDHTDYKFRPGQTVVPIGGNDDSNSATQMVGQIFELDGNGHLVVKWADGSISQRYPQEVFIIYDEVFDESDNDAWDSESSYESDASSGETWETESEQEVDEQIDGSKAEGEENLIEGTEWESHRQELDALLGRAQNALERLQRLLNTFDVTVQAPDCFHDILRIFRSCHDLDKILKSSFFRDPELRSLVAQAKQELKREKANKFSKHLNQVFESWSQNMPSITGSMRSFGLVNADGQTLKFSAGKTSKSQPDMAVSDQPGEGCALQDEQQESQGAIGGSDGEHLYSEMSTSIESCGYEITGLKKEFSEPAISNCLIDSVLSERRPSDSVVDGLSSMPQMRTKLEEANLVGENCVAKASKHIQQEGGDDSGLDSKRNDDKTGSGQVAQELCLKICRNLQKQIVLIHEEMNKRTAKLLQAAGNTSDSKSSKENSEKVDVSGFADSSIEAGVKSEEKESTTLPSSEELQKTDTEASKESVVEESELSSEKIEEEESGQDVSEAEEDEAVDESTLSSWTDLKVPCKGFMMQSEALSCHKYISQTNQPSNPRTFRGAVRKELTLFQTSLPDGIFVKGFEDRLDLYSAMILGPEGTPYEDAVFLFDFALPNDYPTSPPLCHYHSYCSDRLNPNLYEDGKVCVSLLGTWSGKGTEVWTSKSNMLQVLVSIQALILVPDPYYNEAAYERQRGTQLGQENNRMYNEMAILKTLQSLSKMCYKLPTLFAEEIKPYLLAHGPKMIQRLRQWMAMSGASLKPTLVNGETSVSSEANSGDSGFGSASPVHPASAPLASHSNGQPSLLESNTEKAPDLPLSPTNGPQQASGNKSFSPNQTHETPSSDESPKPTMPNNVHEGPAAEPITSVSETSDRASMPVTHSDSGSSTSPSNKVSQVSSQLGKLSLSNATNSLNNSSPSSGQEEPAQTLLGETCSNDTCGSIKQPEFSLFPMSRGFCLTLQKNLKLYETALKYLAEETKDAGPDS